MKCDLCDRELDKEEKVYALVTKRPHRKTLLNFCDFCWSLVRKHSGTWDTALSMKIKG